MIVIGGLEGLFITMIPLTFLDGATVKNWSRLGWALVFGVVTFLWWQLLLNQDAVVPGRVRADQRARRAGDARRVHADDRRAVVVLPLPTGRRAEAEA